MSKIIKSDIFGAFIGIVLIVVGLIFSGAICFGGGYLGGVFLKWICGESVANGLNMVLGNIMNHNFTPNDIPLFTAIMTTIGGFFQSSSSKSKSNE